MFTFNVLICLCGLSLVYGRICLTDNETYSENNAVYCIAYELEDGTQVKIGDNGRNLNNLSSEYKIEWTKLNKCNYTLSNYTSFKLCDYDRCNAICPEENTTTTDNDTTDFIFTTPSVTPTEIGSTVTIESITTPITSTTTIEATEKPKTTSETLTTGIGQSTITTKATTITNTPTTITTDTTPISTTEKPTTLTSSTTSGTSDLTTTPTPTSTAETSATTNPITTTTPILAPRTTNATGTEPSVKQNETIATEESAETTRSTTTLSTETTQTSESTTSASTPLTTAATTTSMVTFLHDSYPSSANAVHKSIESISNVCQCDCKHTKKKEVVVAATFYGPFSAASVALPSIVFVILTAFLYY